MCGSPGRREKVCGREEEEMRRTGEGLGGPIVWGLRWSPVIGWWLEGARWLAKGVRWGWGIGCDGELRGVRD